MKWTPFPVALAAVMLLGACGDDNKAASDTSPAIVAVTTPAVDASTTSTLPAPSKIVSLSPTGTEMLFAIGAGDQVAAVDDQSNYPPEALQKPHDLSGLEPNVEAIAVPKVAADWLARVVKLTLACRLAGKHCLKPLG